MRWSRLQTQHNGPEEASETSLFYLEFERNPKLKEGVSKS